MTDYLPTLGNVICFLKVINLPKPKKKGFLPTTTIKHFKDSGRVGSSESLSTASSSCGDVSAIVSPNSGAGNELVDPSGQQLLCVVCGDTRFQLFDLTFEKKICICTIKALNENTDNFIIKLLGKFF